MNYKANIAASGTGSGTVVVPIDLSGRPRDGAARWLTVRSPVGSGVTALQFKLCDGGYSGAYADAPDERIVTRSAESITVTASDTNAAIDTPIESEPPFAGDLYLHLSVTASGAWSLVGALGLVLG